MNLKQLSIGSFNLYNLNEPGLPMYTDKTGWTQAEYDRKIGWTAHQFFANAEFYSDFGRYDVRMTVPAGWTLGARSFRALEERRDDLKDKATSALPEVRRMKRDDITVHGFRSSFRDWAAEATDYPQEMAEMALAHIVGNKVEAAYRRGDMLEKRRAMMQAWADHLDKLRRGQTHKTTALAAMK